MFSSLESQDFGNFLKNNNKKEVVISLVESSITAPRESSFWLGVRLEHFDHWHTYWKNPGTGLKTEVKFKNLPKEIKVEKIKWPTPELFEVGGNTGNGYSHNSVLLLKLSISKSCEVKKYTLPLNVTYLQCKEICIPGNKKLILILNVTKEGKKNKIINQDKYSKEWFKYPVSFADQKDWQFVFKPLDISNLEFQLEFKSPLIKSKAIKEFQFFPYLGKIKKSVPLIKDDSVQIKFKIKMEDSERSNLNQIFGEGKSPGILAYKENKVWKSVELPKFGTATAQFGADENQKEKKDAAESLPLLLLLGFLGGIILNIMPCVLPVLSLKILSFVNQAGNEKSEILKMGLFYTFGILVSFFVLSLVVIGLKGAGEEIGLGFQMQNPIFLIILCMVVMVFSLNLFGVFEVSAPSGNIGGELSQKEGPIGAFFVGMLTTIMATPCSAPFLGPAVAYAFSQTGPIIILVFFDCRVRVGFSGTFIMFPARLVKIFTKTRALDDPF